MNCYSVFHKEQILIRKHVNDTMNVKVDRHEEKKAHEKTMYIK